MHFKSTSEFACHIKSGAERFTKSFYSLVKNDFGFYYKKGVFKQMEIVVKI